MKRFFLFASTLLVTFFAFSQPKYVFYFIGDGMGVNHILASEMYRAEIMGYIGREPLCLTQFPYSGQISTYSASNGITDSSAAGTCLASGEKAVNHQLGLDVNMNPVTSVASVLKQKGWSVGITTSVSIDHATPASFYAHTKNRSDFFSIGSQLVKSGFDFFGGASFCSPHKNDSNLYDLCELNDYSFAHGYDEALSMMDVASKMILIQRDEGADITKKGMDKLPYALDKKSDDLTLPQIVATAIDFLDQSDNNFFLMVEGGAIDWAAHSNDAATCIHEVIEFDKAIQIAYDFYLKHQEETLIVITADHETGGLALGNKDYVLNLKVLQNQTCSMGVLSDEIANILQQNGKKTQWVQIENLLQDKLGFFSKVQLNAEELDILRTAFNSARKGRGTDVKTLYKNVNILSHKAIQILNKKARIGWATSKHTAASVPVFAIGVGAERFTGWHDNSEIAPNILSIVSDGK